MKIQVLSPETILKIAAGEVVERPASVVKELVDNAIDAGAGTIVIEALTGGLEKITVTDDGEGMGPGDLALAVLSHSTSKIKSGADLFNVATMGFRGEALASIGAIAKMSILTRRRQDTAGAILSVVGGQRGEVEAAASPVGTKVTVEDLFFNTPARQKFLGKPAAEFSALANVVHQLLLARPDIRFKLYHNGKLNLSSPGSGSLTDAIASLAGTKIAENLLQCSFQQGGYTLTGFIASPDFHRSNRAMQYFSVNGRPVSLRLAGSALERAFHTLLPSQRYPIAFLNLDVPGDQVDVNVHPTKREVKFSEAGIIYALVLNGCRRGLEDYLGVSRGFIPEVIPYTSPGYSRRPEPDKSSLTVQEGFSWAPAGERIGSSYTILGQVFSTFLVAATADELRLVDQHAAQERVLYEKYLGLLKEGKRAGQVIIPLETPLDGRSRHFLEACLPQLAELGFRLELTEGGMVLREAPILFKKTLSEADVLEILETLQHSEGPADSLADYQQTALKLMACKGAIKANQPLSAAESLQLLLDLDACENNRTCPHGRPIWVAFDKNKLEIMFARR